MVQVLVKKKFHQRNCKFSLRGQTGRAKDATGNLFNLMLEKELLKQELTLMRYCNINNTPNFTQILGLIKTYVPSRIFYSWSTAILGATISQMQTALNFDATAEN
jgi:iron complex outermembrane receptor protein